MILLKTFKTSNNTVDFYFKKDDNFIGYWFYYIISEKCLESISRVTLAEFTRYMENRFEDI